MDGYWINPLANQVTRLKRQEDESGVTFWANIVGHKI